MATLLATTRQRRATVFWGGWAYVAAAIILRVTGNPSGPLAIITIPGGLYRSTRDVLESFVVQASVGPSVILTMYTIAGLSIATLAVYVLDEYAFEQQDYIKGLFSHGSGQFAANIFVLYIFITIFLFILLIFGGLITGQRVTVENAFGIQYKIIPNWGVFAVTLSFILATSPQFLTLACIGMLLTIFTAMVP